METREAAVVILAAGRSERMKERKAFLLFEGRERFIEKIISTYYNWGCREIIVVTGKDVARDIKQIGTVPSGVNIVINDHIEFERFYSVKLGLREINTSPFCFIQNVDNPFIDEAILNVLYQFRSDRKYISPVFKMKGGHPVLLNRQNINTICNWPVDSANFKEVLNTMECITIDMPDDRILININNQEDYKSFFNMKSCEKKSFV